MAAVLNVFRQERRIMVQRRVPRVFRDRCNPLDYLNDREIIERYRLPRYFIFEVVDLVRRDVERPTNRSHSIPAVLQVLVTLRCLAKGNFYSETADLHGISKSSVCVSMDRVLTSICERMNNISFPRREEELRVLKRDFYRLSSFPNVVGAIDCTLIEIIAPKKNEPDYVCRKGFHALNVQAVVDANLRFTNVVCKWPGSVHDSFIFQNSALYQIMSNGINGWLLGDSGYPLRPFLMTPLANTRDNGEMLYNSAHCKTRVVVERAFGVLKSRFRCLHPTGGALPFAEEKSVKAIVACFKLHNKCMDMRVPLPDIDFNDDDDAPLAMGNDLQNGPGQQIRQQLIQRFRR